ncbi:arginine--tRNA ligase [Pelagibacterium montanilacus]|uniref:arginine--tRNA ligase n=1 Tax=Pelagibacterium montanilacus TaxID=2185280 RepID=UPI000F8D6408|nr:arginine--tRNA ligase [Pelagibacterium montanilacus]
MDIFALFQGRVTDALKAAYPQLSGMDDVLGRVVVEPPRDPAHGDISSNAAMVVAKPLGINPREVAARLADHFGADADVETVSVAGPGFLNFRLQDALWHEVIGQVFVRGGDFGRTDFGQGEKVNVEYVSANPTGPMHVGHTRGAVYGDALAALLAYTGHDVTREYYINDAGSQVDTLARSAFLRYREALGEVIEIPAGLYPGDYLVPVGQGLAERFGPVLLDQPEEQWLGTVKDIVLEQMMDLVRADLRKLNIEHDVFFSERTLHGPGGDIEETLDWLRTRDLVYEGRLDPPKGKLPDDWEDREQTLFRATAFGDDTDRALVKSDGSYTYFAADIAYHRNKVKRGFSTIIDVLGADHSGYAARIKAAVSAVSEGRVQTDVQFCQLVKLMRNGEPVKMSKRSGELVTLAEVVEEVGVDATRFMLLFRRNDAPLDFDFALVREQTKDNPVFYVQYAHARTCSVFKNAERDMPSLDISTEALAGADLSQLSGPEERQLLRMVAIWPRQIDAAARAHEPHRVAFYLHELAAQFHSFWARGKDDPALRFVNQNDPTVTSARLAMVLSVRQVLANGLSLLGVTAPTELS